MNNCCVHYCMLERNRNIFSDAIPKSCRDTKVQQAHMHFIKKQKARKKKKKGKTDTLPKRYANAVHKRKKTTIQSKPLSFSPSNASHASPDQIEPLSPLSCLPCPSIQSSSSSHTNQPKQIPTNSSLLIAPSPSKSNSSIIATNSSSCKPSPNSLATLLKSARFIAPFPSVSNKSKALKISSRGSRERMRVAAMERKEEWGRRRRVGPEKVGLLLVVVVVEGAEAGMPWVERRERRSCFGRSKPRALRATFNSW